jgi:phytoene dehydrogenase-like protein
MSQIMPDSLSPSSSYDAIIIGGGHNGLVCANYLARAGKKVAVLERRHIVGGAAGYRGYSRWVSGIYLFLSNELIASAHYQ